MKKDVKSVKEAEKKLSKSLRKLSRLDKNSKNWDSANKEFDTAADDYDKKRDKLNQKCMNYAKSFLGKYGDDSAASHRYDDEGLKIISITEEYADMLYDELVDGLYSKILKD